jgi:hypothetical protein
MYTHLEFRLCNYHQAYYVNETTRAILSGLKDKDRQMEVTLAITQDQGLEYNRSSAALLAMQVILKSDADWLLSKAIREGMLGETQRFWVVTLIALCLIILATAYFSRVSLCLIGLLCTSAIHELVFVQLNSGQAVSLGYSSPSYFITFLRKVLPESALSFLQPLLFSPKVLTLNYIEFFQWRSESTQRVTPSPTCMSHLPPFLPHPSHPPLPPPPLLFFYQFSPDFYLGASMFLILSHMTFLRYNCPAFCNSNNCPAFSNSKNVKGSNTLAKRKRK